MYGSTHDPPPPRHALIAPSLNSNYCFFPSLQKLPPINIHLLLNLFFPNNSTKFPTHFPVHSLTYFDPSGTKQFKILQVCTHSTDDRGNTHSTTHTHTHTHIPSSAALKAGYTLQPEGQASHRTKPEACNRTKPRSLRTSSAGSPISLQGGGPSFY